MTPDFVIAFAEKALFTALLVSAPMLVAALVVGVVISLLQAITQLQEMTLAFVPKIVAVFVAALVALPWMTETLMHFARESFDAVLALVR